MVLVLNVKYLNKIMKKKLIHYLNKIAKFWTYKYKSSLLVEPIIMRNITNDFEKLIYPQGKKFK